MPRARTSRLPSTQTLSQSWPRVRQALVRHCGIVRGHGEKVDPRTPTVFADSTRLSAAHPCGRLPQHHADGRAQGISTHNPRPCAGTMAVGAPACPETCASSSLAPSPSGRPYGSATSWCWPSRGRPRCHGRPTGRLPPVRAPGFAGRVCTRLHPAFAEQVQAYVARVLGPSAPQAPHAHRHSRAHADIVAPPSRRRRVRTRTLAAVVCRIPLDLKRGPSHPKADLQCLSPLARQWPIHGSTAAGSVWRTSAKATQVDGTRVVCGVFS